MSEKGVKKDSKGEEKEIKKTEKRERNRTLAVLAEDAALLVREAGLWLAGLFGRGVGLVALALGLPAALAADGVAVALLGVERLRGAARCAG